MNSPLKTIDNLIISSPEHAFLEGLLPWLGNDCSLSNGVDWGVKLRSAVSAGQSCLVDGDVSSIVCELAEIIAVAVNKNAKLPAILVVSAEDKQVLSLFSSLSESRAQRAWLEAWLSFYGNDGKESMASTGRLAVVGLGPGDIAVRTPEVQAELTLAEDIVGYQTYVEMAGSFRADQQLHASDNRQELMRARDALRLAVKGRRVAVVSSGDPGIFAMASAVFEALADVQHPEWDARWLELDLQVLPGITAAQALAATCGAPLGHDFCIISLSDNLKPWSVVATRLASASQADMVIALYNPASKARPQQFDDALAVIRSVCLPSTIVVLGRDIRRPGGNVRITTLGELEAGAADMRTLIIIGSSQTRLVEMNNKQKKYVFTARTYPEK